MARKRAGCERRDFVGGTQNVGPMPEDDMPNCVLDEQPRPTTNEHRRVWEAAHGPIPKGFHIHHRDGNPCNNDIKNLMCMTREAHMRWHAEHDHDARLERHLTKKLRGLTR